jgi:hypothetical protein
MEQICRACHLSGQELTDGRLHRSEQSTLRESPLVVAELQRHSYCLRSRLGLYALTPFSKTK